MVHREFAAGECLEGLVFGENLLLDPTNTVQYSQTKMMSKEGHCKTFDASANGYVSYLLLQIGLSCAPLSESKQD